MVKCVVCDSDFEKAGATKFCSDVCRKSAVKERKRLHHIKNKAANKERKRLYYIKNKESIKEKDRLYYIKNEVVAKERMRLYKIKNAEKVKEADKKWKNNNKHKVTAALAKRRALKIQATVSIVDNIEFFDVYKKSKILQESTGVIQNVDHIVPLNHPDVCGLHAPWNLQILTYSENCSKSNKFDGTYNNDSWRNK